MTGEDAIWHVVIGGEQHGPLSRSQVLEYLHDERLLGSDLIWRPGFSDWKSISEVTDFWQPPRRGSPRPPPMPAPTEQPERDNNQINAVATNKKWSIWRAANAGLLVAVLPLALQIANGRGGGRTRIVRSDSNRRDRPVFSRSDTCRTAAFRHHRYSPKHLQMAAAEIRQASYRGRNRVRLLAALYWRVARALRAMVLQQHRSGQRRDARLRYEQDATCLRPAADVT
jgi:GYF domain 2